VTHPLFALPSHLSLPINTATFASDMSLPCRFSATLYTLPHISMYSLLSSADPALMTFNRRCQAVFRRHHRHTVHTSRTPYRRKPSSCPPNCLILS